MGNDNLLYSVLSVSLLTIEYAMDHCSGSIVVTKYEPQDSIESARFVFFLLCTGGVHSLHVSSLTIPFDSHAHYRDTVVVKINSCKQL